MGKITQGVEEDIIAALKEMIDALKKAHKGKKGKAETAEQRGAAPRTSRSDVSRPLGRVENDPGLAGAGQHRAPTSTRN